MSTLSIGKYGYHAGTAGTLTLPNPAKVLSVRAHSTAGGSFTINGGDSIPVPAGANWFEKDFGIGELPNRAVFVFTGTDSFYVDFLTTF